MKMPPILVVDDAPDLLALKTNLATVAVVDAFEAMTTTRFHREPTTTEQASQEILRCAGTRYHPTIKTANPAAASKT